MLIRDADMSDVKDIFDWRNDFFSRSMSVNMLTVGLKDHIDWYERSLKDPLRRLYVGIIEDTKVGVVRFDRNPDADISELSINLNPLLRGKGYGFTLLFDCIKLYEQKNGVVLLAKIKKENLASLHIFGKCQFLRNKEDEYFYYLTRG